MATATGTSRAINAPGKTSSAAVAVKNDQPNASMKEILEKAGKRALGGGLPGAMAMGIQVVSLMWLRTTMNYQYRYGTSTTEAMRKLYAEGGVPRFYRGLGAALFQGPLSRFGDTAANAGILSLLEANEGTKNLPIAVKTLAASTAASGWRIFLMPIDCVKTTLQVEGASGIGHLSTKIRRSGPGVLYHGALGAAGATLLGHYPWFFTFNFLNESLPKPKADETWKKLGRNAVIGFSASVVSDTISNSVRVIKTTKQTHADHISYPQAVRHVIEADGIRGLFFRGLQTRILANGLQGMLFTILWRGIHERYFKDA